MKDIHGRRLFFFLLLALVMGCTAGAQIIENIQTGIEDLARGMDYLGRRTGEIIGSGLSFSEGDSTVVVAERTFDEQYSVGPTPMLFLSNEFGEIRVNVWNERLVRINASIMVGAETRAAAEQVAELIDVNVTEGIDFLECRSQLPDIKGGGKVSMTVNYQVLLPRDANLSVENYFGDVYVAGLAGTLTAGVQYGDLELSQISGTVRAQVIGAFQVRAAGLKQGGVFTLQNADADFSDFQGELSVQHFRGSVTFRRPAPQSSIILSSDNGHVQIVLPATTRPDLNATLSYGKFESQVEVTRQERGRQLLVKRSDADADHHILINAAFSDVSIAMEGKNFEGALPAHSDFKAFTDLVTENIPISEDNSMVLQAIPGNIHIEGIEGTELSLAATRVVWAPSVAAGMGALEALHLDTDQNASLLSLKSLVAGSMATWGCESYRVDFDVQAPHSMPMVITAEEGITTITNMTNGCQLSQKKGEIILDSCQGELRIDNKTGAVTLKNCGGAAVINTRSGAAVVESMDGNLVLNVAEGPVYIDAPGGDVSIHCKGGDVRLLSLEPVRGNYDILVEDGNLNAFINPNSDASITVRTGGGRVQSALPLLGSINQDVQEFFGRINEGNYTVVLESRNGDVILN